MFFVSSVLLILLFIFVGLYARSSTHSPPVIVPPHHPKKQPVCLESSCIKTAASILQDVDPALSPCQDFYAYTCNQWMNSHIIPATQDVVNLPTMTTQSIRYRLHQLLTSTTFDINGLPNPDRVLDRQLFNKLTDFYQSCLRRPPPSGGVDLLYPIFREIIKQGSDGTINEFLAERGIWTLFEIKIGPDLLEAPGRTAIHLSLPSKIKLEEERYVEGLSAILKLVFERDTEFEWRKLSAQATARRIVEFEREWKVKESLVLRRWTAEELQREVPEIRWSSFANGRPILVQQEVLEKIKKNAAVKGRTLQMYQVWRTLWTYMDALGEEFMEQKQWLQGLAKPERWETCLSMVDAGYLGPLLGRYFLLDHAFKPAIEQVRLETQKLVSQLEKRMQGREEMIEKLKGMQFEIGYATHASLNILDVLSLAEYYGELQMDQEKLFENMLNVHMQAYIQARRELKQAQIKPPVFNPTSTEIVYRYEYNQVIVPAGLLQFPYFDVQGPDYLYQGTLGWMIGQAVMHGFDDIGKKYNQGGLLGDWWKDESSKSCLISQYNTLGVDGDQTLNNNFADNAALIYDSNSNMTIPGLGQWTREQLFYIQFARMKCSKTTDQYKWTNTSPDRYRVNVPLMNSPHFSKTFNCKADSFMNPKHKCQVW
ncbi:unnamed protein product [Rhizopus stolonifer]